MPQDINITEVRERIQKADYGWRKNAGRSPRLKVLAAYINQAHPELRAEIVKGYCDTDQHPKGVCWRIPGKGRRGNQLEVWKDGQRIFVHNSAETYRHNYEVCQWIIKYEEELLGQAREEAN